MGHLSDIDFPTSPLMKPDSAPAGAASLLSGSARTNKALVWSAGLVIAVLLGYVYADSLAYLLQQWIEDDNYSHGFFVPLIVGTLIWWRRERARQAGVAPSWWGVAVVLVGLALFVVGELATLYVVLHLSFWLVLVGLVVVVIGPRASRELAFPLGYLLTMFPLPQMLEQNLSASLQLLSSAFGVGCLQLIGVTVFREGNVIDLGPIQLQVVEACSGLRYLFPLTSLALLCGYLFHDRLWKKVLLVASAIPLAIVLNGLRIGMIGALMEWYGLGVAEGFMHAFEGWLVFVVSFSVLLGEMWLLSRLGQSGTQLFPVWMAPMPGVSGQRKGTLTCSPALITCLLLIASMAVLAFALQGREEINPERKSFLEFPMEIAGWKGTPMTLERQYVDVLRFDDYLLAEYQAPGNGSVNLYVAYYGSQKKGRSAHSPKTCLPGGGWEMSSMTETSIAADETGRAFEANRVLIQKGEARQMVLYWFKQRDRLVTNEYFVKAWLFWDALTRRRSDGALIRLISPLLPGEDEIAADRRLHQFAALVEPRIAAYVPD